MNPFYFLLFVSFSDSVIGRFLLREANERIRKQLEADRPCNFLLTYEERYLSTPDIITKYGYPSERHWVTTEDGYILELHRIPAQGKPVAFLMHGIFGTSRDWVINCDHRALAFKLHEEGYDVWLGNYRGNTYSHNHTSLNASDARFWNFTIDEVGHFDGPASIDYVLNVTEKESLSFIAHSMGNGVALTMLLSRPEYNKKIDAWFALSAATQLQDTRSPPVVLLAPFYRLIEVINGTNNGPACWPILYLMNSLVMIVSSQLLTFYNRGEFLPHAAQRFLSRYSPMLCHYEAITKNPHGLCSISYFLIDGYDPAQIPSEAFRTFTAGFPAQMSARFATQWFQWVISGKFTKFDEGPFANIRKYGHPQAERYDITLLSTNVYLFWGENDWVVTKKSVEKTWPIITSTPGLKEMVHFIRVNSTTFNHMDFVLGKDADVLVYNPLIKILNKHNGIEASEPSTLTVENNAITDAATSP